MKKELFCESEIVGEDSLSLSPPTVNKPKFDIRIDPSIKNNTSIIQLSALDNEPTKPTDGRTRVMFCGTYPIGQSNGYSRVVYYIAKFLGLKEDFVLTIYGFQNFNQTAGSDSRKDIPPTVKLHDALSTENPRRNGFGEKEVATFLKQNPQDIVIIFNDMVVTGMLINTIVNEMSLEQRKQFKMVSYMDQVYPYQRKEFIHMLNTYFDAIIAFTPYWRDTARTIGLDRKIPCYVFPHGFDHTIYYPMPRQLARRYFNIPENAFAILNLNRNQPRKRWDHAIMAFAIIVKRYHDLFVAYENKEKKDDKKHKQITKPSPVRLVVGTSMDSCWVLMDVLEHELKLLGVPWEFGKECIIPVTNPQLLSDRDINILYNSCDIGLNTCEGEGFGLCQIEHMAVGSPQVVQRIGGMQEFLNSDNSMLVETKLRYYIDKSRDSIGGIAELGDPKDFADAMWKYYTDRKLLDKHAKAGRVNILQHYRWNIVVDHFHTILSHIRDSK